LLERLADLLALLQSFGLRFLVGGGRHSLSSLNARVF
jgi:hypothetical protein